MDYSVKSVTSPINKAVRIPGSKSITNRALLLASLARGTSCLSGVLLSDDTLVFIQALTALGVKLSFSEDKKECKIEGVNGLFPQKKAEIYCNEAGTAARFLLAACAINPGEFHFDGSGRLRMRPLAPLIEILKDQGVRFIPDDAVSMPFNLFGKQDLFDENIFVPGDVSSQFLSALLMVAPFSKTQTTFKTHQQLISRPYVTLTCTMMQEFGVTVDQVKQDEFKISAPQFYRGRNYLIEPDLSTASYFFAAAAITGGHVKLLDIDRANCKQGDIQFLEILEQMGCVVENCSDNIKIYGSKKLKGLEVDMGDISDTFMTLACLAPFADKPTTINNISHTKFQECNRIEAVSKNLDKLGINVVASDSSITIYPGKIKPANIDSYGDHRIAMSFSLIGLVVPGVTIKNMDCVSKTCPNFIELWEFLGE